MIFKLIWQNKKFILGLIVALWILTVLPAIYGYFATPSNFHFTGIEYLVPGDFHSYLSYFEQVKQGNFILRDLYTSEEQTSAIFNPFFLMFGLLGKLFDLPNIITHHLARLILIPFLIAALFAFFRRIFKEMTHLRVVMLFAVFSSGLGSFISPFIHYFKTSEGYIHWPMDLWVPESNIFLTILRNPLYIAALTLIILTFLFFINAIEKNQIRWSVLAGLSAMLLFFIHPYHVLTIYAIPLLWVALLMIREGKIIFPYLGHYLLLFLISLPPIMFTIYLTLTDFIARNRYYSVGGPPTVFWLTILSYGFLFLLAIPSCLNFLKNIFNKQTDKSSRNNTILFCAAWAIGGFLIIYFPFFKHGRRLTLGLQIPLIVFTVITLMNVRSTSLYKKLKDIVNIKIAFLLFFILAFMASNIYVLTAHFQVYADRSNQYAHIPIEVYQAMRWLKSNTAPNQDVVLTDQYYGNLIPGIIGRTVYLGHFAETVHFNLKERMLIAFFSKNRSNGEEVLFLKNNRITHIFYTENLKTSGAWRPENKDYLSKVFENEKTVTYKID